MHRRMLIPVLDQLMHLPQRECIHIAVPPSGDGDDVAIDPAPISYPVTGCAYPGAFLRNPDASSTALKTSLKFSTVIMLSSFSCVRSGCALLSDARTSGIRSRIDLNGSLFPNPSSTGCSSRSSPIVMALA